MITQGSYLGPEYSQKDIEFELSKLEQFMKLNEKDLLTQTVKDRGNGEVIGWFQGRMEFGPRATGKINFR